MDNLKRKLTENSRLQMSVGLKSATKEEIEDLKNFLSEKQIPFRHVQVSGTNGAIHINKEAR